VKQVNDTAKIIVAGTLLVTLAVLPGLIGFWQTSHSLVLIIVIGLGVYYWETRQDGN
jgi:hypothetical protein